MPQKFVKKPITIEAWQWNEPEEAYDIEAWINGCEVTCHAEFVEQASGPVDPRTGDDWGLFEITTLEGVMVVEPHGWVIRGVEGEFYPCKESIFAATYDAV